MLLGMSNVLFIPDLCYCFVYFGTIEVLCFLLVYNNLYKMNTYYNTYKAELFLKSTRCFIQFVRT